LPSLLDILTPSEFVLILRQSKPLSPSSLIFTPIQKYAYNRLAIFEDVSSFWENLEQRNYFKFKFVKTVLIFLCKNLSCTSTKYCICFNDKRMNCPLLSVFLIGRKFGKNLGKFLDELWHHFRYN